MGGRHLQRAVSRRRASRARSSTHTGMQAAEWRAGLAVGWWAEVMEAVGTETAGMVAVEMVAAGMVEAAATVAASVVALTAAAAMVVETAVVAEEPSRADMVARLGG